MRCRQTFLWCNRDDGNCLHGPHPALVSSLVQATVYIMNAASLDSCPLCGVFPSPKAVVIDLHSCNGITHGNTADPIPCYTSSTNISVEMDFGI